MDQKIGAFLKLHSRPESQPGEVALQCWRVARALGVDVECDVEGIPMIARHTDAALEDVIKGWQDKKEARRVQAPG